MKNLLITSATGDIAREISKQVQDYRLIQKNLNQLMMDMFSMTTKKYQKFL